MESSNVHSVGIPSRTQKSLERSIEKGGQDLYEAHQIILTLVRRHTSAGRHSDAIHVLYNYALKLKANSKLCADLGRMYVETCIAGGLNCTTSKLTKLLEILQALNMQESGNSAPELINAIFDFYQKHLETEDVDAVLGIDDVVADVHRLAADFYEANESYGKSQLHRIAAVDIDGLLHLRDVWQDKCFPSEKHLLALRMTCLLVLSGHASEAEALLLCLPVEWEEEDIDVELQLAYLLTAAAVESSASFYKVLRQKFRLVLRRDPKLDKLFTEIGHQTFGLPREQPRNLLSAFFN
ncbi:MAG: uncharacterized protein KVP18_002911 [Porospora cf. gigantea A]|uniref:uncharacterized protein n=2 Tax=Porospora cf. gigantea A TaxID=2853593 RepID=UPI003559A876|nr:MAG: hypothetical protein KVP18_002911 [Porospora cf. gigantea A]